MADLEMCSAEEEQELAEAWAGETEMPPALPKRHGAVAPQRCCWKAPTQIALLWLATRERQAPRHSAKEPGAAGSPRSWHGHLLEPSGVRLKEPEDPADLRVQPSLACCLWESRACWEAQPQPARQQGTAVWA